MNTDLEAAVRSIIKSVVKEVANELRSQHSIPVVVQRLEPPEHQAEILLTSREAAKRLAISERHLYSLTQNRELPCVRLGRNVRYSVETIKKWIQAAEKASLGSETTRVSKPSNTNEKREGPKITPPSVTPTQLRKAPSGRRPKDLPVHDTTPQTKQPSIKPVVRFNPFRRLLEEIGIDEMSIPPQKNGELMRIAEVDRATFHGWMHLGRALPKGALEKLRNHFLLANGEKE